MALFRSLIRIFSGQAILQGFGMLSNELPTTSGTESPHMDALKAVSLTSNYIAQTSQMNMFATMFFGVLEPNTGLVSYVNGGHELPIIVGADGVVKHRLKPTGPAVGMMPNMKFKVQQVQLSPGDILMTYTDGVPEAHSPDGTFFTEKQLVSLVEQHTESASAMLDMIEERLRAHMGDREQFDDITMLAVRWASR
jgi:sigma-B regulation protein RsbU (phosphoserine phosphatase)